MPFRVSGKNLDIGDALRVRVNARVVEAIERHFQGGYSGHVTVSREGFGFRTECTVHLASGITLESEATEADAYASADQAALRIEKRLRRYHRRLKDRQASREVAEETPPLAAASYVIAAPDQDAEEESGFAPVIVAESTTTLSRLSVSEAVSELDLTGAPVVIFRNAGNDRMNVVYRRPDGNIGWIDPPPLQHAAAH